MPAGEDVTAASHIAAADVDTTLRPQQEKLTRLSSAGGDDTNVLVQRLRRFLIDSHYTTPDVAKIFFLRDEDHPLATCCCPIYLTPVTAGAGSSVIYPWPSNEIPTPLQCLVALFLLGLAVPLDIVESSFSQQGRGDAKADADGRLVQLLLDCGLVMKCQQHQPPRRQQRPSSQSDGDGDDDDNSSNKSTLLLVAALVQIYPISLPKEDKTLYLMTDWHPRVLSSTTVAPTGEADAVMYIGPDTVAMIQHALLSKEQRCFDSVLDLCTGSGVLALVCLATGLAERAICVDVNPRALLFTAINSALNGIDLSTKVHLVLGNLLTGQGQQWTPPYQKTVKSASASSLPKAEEAESEESSMQPLRSLLESLLAEASVSTQRHEVAKRVMMTINPPFLPVPPTLDERRHGLFSAPVGDTTGEQVLLQSLRLASSMSCIQKIAVVSEFFLNGGDTYQSGNDKNDIQQPSADALMGRLQRAWQEESRSVENDEEEDVTTTTSPTTTATKAKGLLFTNQVPISVNTYAERRADSLEEFQVWQQHLAAMNIVAASPGLLYIEKIDGDDNNNDDDKSWAANTAKPLLRIEHVLVPKTDMGSIWTPSNEKAVLFTQARCRDYFGA